MPIDINTVRLVGPEGLNDAQLEWKGKLMKLKPFSNLSVAHFGLFVDYLVAHGTEGDYKRVRRNAVEETTKFKTLSDNFIATLRTADTAAAFNYDIAGKMNELDFLLQ